MNDIPRPSPKRLSSQHARAAARVHRLAFDARFPWLAGLHTPEEDARFYEDDVFRNCAVWGIHDGPDLVGIIAFHAGWLDHLYVLPAYQGQGYGHDLLEVVKSQNNALELWTFQSNTEARAFYERHGFEPVELTDGSTNEEREPDIRYRWQGDNLK